MARAPDKRIEQAKGMYLKGMKLVEIASQLNLPEGTVRRWKSTHRWDNERSDKKSERSDKKKRGGQPGNQNATGPPGNKNAVKTGEFEALFAIYGTLLADDEVDENGEKKEGAEAAMKHLKKRKVLEVPDGAKAEYLTRTFDETGVEVLKKAIEQDIHKFSHIPCMTDESFGGNVSGVAMEFKVLGMENITKIKTRYYKKGLRKRLRLFCGYLSLYQKNVDPKGITMVFTRSLPKNLLEISQIVANLWGKVSRRTLLSQIPFVEDVDEELNALEKETQENLENQQKMFGNDPNTKPDQPGEASAEDDVSHDEKE